MVIIRQDNRMNRMRYRVYPVNPVNPVQAYLFLKNNELKTNSYELSGAMSECGAVEARMRF